MYLSVSLPQRDSDLPLYTVSASGLAVVLGWTLASSKKIRMFSSGESRTCISCRSSSILPADADVKLEAGSRHRRGFLCLGDVLRLHAFPALVSPRR